MFKGFELGRIAVGAVELRVRYGGSGPPVVLLNHVAEDAPEALAKALLDFLGG